MQLKKALRFAGLAAVVVLFVTGCSLAPLFNGEYFSTSPGPGELGFIPKGDNIALGADVYVSSSLENNLGLVNPSNPSIGTWREFALWIGWVKTALNDGVVTSPETGSNTEQVSSGWSTETAGPEQNLPSWVMYDFGQPVDITAFGLFPRTDTPTGPDSNLPQDFEVFTASTINLDFILANRKDYNPAEYPAVWSRPASVSDENGVVYDDGIVTHSGDNFPSSLTEQLFSFQSTTTARYLFLYITRAGGNFVQMAEFAVYKP